MKFNKDRDWLKTRADQEDQHSISVGGMVALVPAPWQADFSNRGNVLVMRAAFGRPVRLARRERRLSVEQLAKDADIDLAEAVKIEENKRFQPSLRTIHHLASFLDLPAKGLMVLGGLLPVEDGGLEEASIRFVARCEPVQYMSPEERAALQEYVKFLSER